MRRKWNSEDTALWFKLSVNNPGYIVNRIVIDRMFDDYDLLDKEIVRFNATPQGIDGFDSDGKRYYRRWKGGGSSLRKSQRK